MPRLIVNLQGSLSNPNVALEAAKRGDLPTIPPGATCRIDGRATADALVSGVCATCVTVGHVVGAGDAVSRTHQACRIGTRSWPVPTRRLAWCVQPRTSSGWPAPADAA